MTQAPVFSSTLGGAGRTTFHIPPDEPIIVIRRVFDAPRRRVWEACTRPEHLVRWWGPRGSTLTVCNVDLRIDGTWRFVVRLPDGSEHGFGGEYREIVPQERIVQTYRYDGYPEAVAVETFELTEADGRTVATTTVRHASITNRDGHVLSGMEEGASQSWQRLAEEVGRMGPPLHEVTLTRALAAPPDRVFRAWTRAEQLRQWFGPRDVEMPVCELDARPGGPIRFCHALPGGRALWFQGVFVEVTPGERLVFDLAFVDAEGRPAAAHPVPGWPDDGVITTTVTLAATAGGTHMTVHQAVRSADSAAAPAVARERAMAAEGWVSTLERLEAFVAGPDPRA